LFSEADIAKRRLDHEAASRAAVDKTTHGAIHGGKKGNSVFTRMIKAMTDGSSA